MHDCTDARLAREERSAQHPRAEAQAQPTTTNAAPHQHIQRDGVVQRSPGRSRVAAGALALIHAHTHTATRRNGCNAAGARMWRMEKTRGSVGRGRDLLRQRTPHPIYEAALPPLHACASVLSTCRGEPAPAAAAAAAVCHGVCRRAAAHRFDAVRARRGEEISVPKSESAVTRGPPGARVTRTPASAEHMCASA